MFLSLFCLCPSVFLCGYKTITLPENSEKSREMLKSCKDQCSTINTILSLFCPRYCLITTTVTDINIFIQVEECLSVAWDSKFVKPRHHLPSVGSSCPLMTDLRHCVEASPHPHSWGIAPSCPAVGNKSFSPDFLWDKWQESNKKNCQDVKMLKPPNNKFVFLLCIL